MSILICPVCGGEMHKEENCLKCQNSHSFDFAKEGYVNLLTGSKSGDKRGDSKESARARRAFLEKDYYYFLKEEIAKRLKGTVLDICCGEGYYDKYDGELYGFDISKEMVRLAAKRNKGGKYFVANLSNIPVKSESVDTAIHLFAPFNSKEFSRILKTNGRLYSVVPAKEHLYEMKTIVYDNPYYNDEKVPECKELEIVSKNIIKQKSEICCEDIKTLFSMTPYYYRTSEENKKRLDRVSSLDLTFSFIITEYKKAL